MGISGSVYSRPAKTSTLIADADLDMGAFDVEAVEVRTDDILEKTGAAGVKIVGLKADTIAEKTGATGVTIDGVKLKDDQVVTLEAVAPAIIPKIASDILRNSYDAQWYHASTGAAFIEAKTFTFPKGIKGVLRCKFCLLAQASYTAHGMWYKNGISLGGTDHSTSESGSCVVKTEDVDVGTILPGETLELWGKAEHASAAIWITNARLYYDGEVGAVEVNNS